MNMLERCARGLARFDGRERVFEDPTRELSPTEFGLAPAIRQRYIDRAQAVLDTLAEPDAAMVEAGQEADRMSGDPHGLMADSRTIFTAMIRAATPPSQQADSE